MRTSIGARANVITLQLPGTPVRTGGTITQTWADLTPGPATVYGRVAPAAQADLERIGGGGTLTMASRLVTIPYHAGVRATMRVTWIDRHGAAHTANVTGFANTADETETTILCEEVLP